MTKPLYYYHNSTYCCFSITLPEPELQTSKLTILINVEGLSNTLWPNKEHHSITASWVLIIEEKNIITSQEGPLGFFALTRQTESTGIFVLCEAVISHSGASENAYVSSTIHSDAKMLLSRYYVYSVSSGFVKPQRHWNTVWNQGFIFHLKNVLDTASWIVRFFSDANILHDMTFSYILFHPI